MMRTRPYIPFRALLLALGAAVSAHAAAQALPPGLVFTGLQSGGWQLFVVDESGAPRAVETESEPRTPAYAKTLKRLAYIAADGDLREIDLRSGEDRVLLAPNARESYTQPAYAAGADTLYVVTLRQGNSVDTDIAVVDRTKGTTRPVVELRSAQFEPYLSADGRRLFYSHVVCTVECGKIIQELWVRDQVTGEANQLTLINAISRQPHEAADGSVLFSSNRAGHYHIWRLPAAGGTPEALTSGTVTDDSPVAHGDTMYFLRRSPEGARLMRVRPGNEPEPVPLPVAVSDVKDLRLGR